MSTFRWKKLGPALTPEGAEVGTITAEKTAAGVVLHIQPDDDYYSGTLDQWTASELMLLFYSMIKKDPSDKPPAALVMMVREICKMRATGQIPDRALGFVEICALLGVDWLPFQEQRGGQQQFSIARALDSFDPHEEASLCAFLAKAEEARIPGDALQGWRITRDLEGCKLEAMTVTGQQLRAVAPTFAEACRDIGKQFVDVALRGAPEA